MDENVVWAGATSGAFFRTIDGGNTWTDRFITGSGGVSFYSVAPIDQNTAYLAGRSETGPDARIFKTTDGGLTWTQQYRNTKSGAAFFGIAFWDRDNGIAFSDPVEGSFLIVTTANGGTTWEEVPKANIPPPLAGELGGLRYNGAAMAVEGMSNAWFGTSQASPDRIFRTRDKGRTWTVANTPFRTGTSGQEWGITFIAFIDSLNGYARGGIRTGPSSGVGDLGRTTDGGQTWSIVTTAPNHYSLVYVPGMGHSGLVMLGEGGSYYSQDGGTTWKPISSTSFYGGLTFASPTAGWAMGLLVASRIAKFDGDLRTAVADWESAMPHAFELAQNYPNPFNPGTRIKFHLPVTSLVRLEVHNVLGQHIATLLEEKRPAGEHELTWDGRNDLGQPVPSGVYLLSIRAGEFTQTRKMVLTR